GGGGGGADARRAVSAGGALPHGRGVRGGVPARGGGPGGRDGGGGAMSVPAGRPGGAVRPEAPRPAARRAPPPEHERADRVWRVALPIAMLLLGLLAWELIVRVRGIPPYVLPAPELVFRTL